MDFTISDEQRMILEYGNSLAQTYGRAHWLEMADRREFPRAMWEQAGADGFLGLMVDEAYGGAGLGMTEMAYFMEGLGREGIPLLMVVVGPTMVMSLLNTYGTEEQKQCYLPGGCSGKKVYCFAITEPTAGTNTIHTTTVARKDGKGFRLSGQKTFITGADIADYAMVVTRTQPFKEVARKTDGFTLFMVDMKLPGIDIKPINISITAPERQCQIFFDDVTLGGEHVVGEVDQGFKILFDALNPERIVGAAMGIGLGRFALGKAVDYVNERAVFGKPIGSHQGLAHPLAHCRTEIEMATLMTYKAAWAFDQELPAGEYANMAKYYAAEAAIHAIDQAVQCFGGNGFTRDFGIYDTYPLARLLRTAPISKEMILNYIGEKVMGLPRSY